MEDSDRIAAGETIEPGGSTGEVVEEPPPPPPPGATSAGRFMAGMLPLAPFIIAMVMIVTYCILVLMNRTASDDFHKAIFIVLAYFFGTRARRDD